MRINRENWGVVLITFLLLSSILAQPVVAISLKGIGGGIVGGAQTAKNVSYLTILWVTVWRLIDDIENNLVFYILHNPDVSDPAMKRLMGFFMHLLQPFYVLAIAVTAFYMIFVSSSFQERASAKTWLTKLILGLILVSLSPQLIQIVFVVSETLSSSILSNADVDTAVEEYTSVIDASKMAITAAFFPEATIGGIKGLARWGAGRVAVGGMKTILSRVAKLGNIEIKPDWTVPFLFITILLVLGVYGIIALRYMMVLLWTALLPLSIFLASFRVTRNLGNRMLEHTLIWTFLQVFYTVILLTMSLGITVLPLDVYRNFSIGFEIPGFGVLLSIFGITACLLLFLGPFFLLTLLRNLLPP